MKPQKLIALLAGLLVIGGLGLGCAKKNEAVGPSVATTPDNTTTVVDSRNATPGFSYQGGGSSQFTPESLTVMNTYVATHPLNSPAQFQINVNLSDLGSGRYGGDVQISYYDNHQYYNGYFQSGKGTVTNSYRSNGKSEAEYNQWFTKDGKRVFHGFFQDQYGSIVLVIDNSSGNGDGGLPQYASGEVWFKNFGQQNCAYPPIGATSPCGQSALKCWFIEVGPYDCRTFMSGGTVVTNSAIYPSTANGYTRLGKFADLEIKKAFNIP